MTTDGLPFSGTESHEPIVMPVEEDENCEFCGQVTIYDRVTGDTFKANCRRRTCPNSRRSMARRVVKQIQFENATKKKRVKAGCWEAYKEKMRRNGTRFKSFPQDNGDTICLQDEEGEDLPVDEQELADAVEEWLKDMPGNKRTGGTRANEKTDTEGFGGEFWSGSRNERSNDKWARLEVPWSRAATNVSMYAKGLHHTADDLIYQAKEGRKTGRMNLAAIKGQAEEILRG